MFNLILIGKKKTLEIKLYNNSGNKKTPSEMPCFTHWGFIYLFRVFLWIWALKSAIFQTFKLTVTAHAWQTIPLEFLYSFIQPLFTQVNPIEPLCSASLQNFIKKCLFSLKAQMKSIQYSTHMLWTTARSSILESFYTTFHDYTGGCWGIWQSAK